MRFRTGALKEVSRSEREIRNATNSFETQPGKQRLTRVEALFFAFPPIRSTGNRGVRATDFLVHMNVT